MSRLRHYLVNLSAQTLGRICSMGASFLVFVLAARLLGTEEFGQFSYIMTFLGLAVIMAEFGTTGVLAKSLSQAGPQAARYWGNFLLLRIGLCLAVMAAAALIAVQVRPDLSACLLMGCLALPFLSSRLFEPVYQIFQRPWYSFRASALYALLYAALAVALLYGTRALLPVVVAYGAANVVYTLVAGVLAFRLLRPCWKPDRPVLSELLRLAAPIGISNVFVMINTRADIFMLAWLQSDAAVGMYNTAFRFFEMAAILAVMASTPLIPVFSQAAVRSGRELGQLCAAAAELLGVAVLPVAILTPLVSPVMIVMLFGKAYAPAAPVLNILAWVAALVFFSLLGATACLALGVTRYKYWCAPLTAALNIVLNYLWIPRYSYTGSAWATLICEIVLAGITFGYVIKNVGSLLRLGVCVKISGANITLWAVAQLLAGQGRPVALSVAVTVYVLMLIVLQLTPWRIVQRLRQPDGSGNQP